MFTNTKGFEKKILHHSVTLNIFIYSFNVAAPFLSFLAFSFPFFLDLDHALPRRPSLMVCCPPCFCFLCEMMKKDALPLIRMKTT